MKKEEGFVSPYGISGTVLGTLSLALMFSQPVAALVCSIVSLVFSSKEKKHGDARWARISKILGIIGLIGSILVFVAGIIILTRAAQNPALFSNLGSLQ